MNNLLESKLTLRCIFSIFISGLCMVVAHPGNADAPPLNHVEIYIYGPGIAQVMDMYGRRTGRDLGTGDILEEIPRSKVIEEGTKERMPGWTIRLQDPVQGVYRVKLMATGSGAFAVDVDTVDSIGKLKNSHVFRRVKPGESLEFVLIFTNDPEGESTLLQSKAP
jgi:hypothetical protein